MHYTDYQFLLLIWLPIRRNFESKQLTHAPIFNNIKEERRLRQWWTRDDGGGDWLNGTNSKGRKQKMNEEERRCSTMSYGQERECEVFKI